MAEVLAGLRSRWVGVWVGGGLCPSEKGRVGSVGKEAWTLLGSGGY